MNDERVAAVRGFLEGRLSAADASRLIEALLGMEIDARQADESSCPPPPWREFDFDRDLDELFCAEGCPALLQAASRQICRGLADGDIRLAVSRLAMLDVAYLAEFWAHDPAPGYMFCAAPLAEREDGLHLKGASLYFSGDSLAMRLFGPHPVPHRRPEGLQVLDREEEGRKLVYQVEPDGGTVTTAAGTFSGCLKVIRRFDPDPERSGEPEGAEPGEMRAVWMAPGVGPVRARFERSNGQIFEIELVEYIASGDDGFFPREPGNRWLFEGTDAGFPHRELWRILAPHGDEAAPWMSLAGCPHPMEDE